VRTSTDAPRIETAPRSLLAIWGQATGSFLEEPLAAWEDVRGSKLGPGAMARAALDRIDSPPRPRVEHRGRRS